MRKKMGVEVEARKRRRGMAERREEELGRNNNV